MHTFNFFKNVVFSVWHGGQQNNVLVEEEEKGELSGYFITIARYVLVYVLLLPIL